METPYRPTIRTQSDLEAVWRHLMGPWGFGGRSIWLLRIESDGTVLPHVVEIAECDGLPDDELVDGLAGVLRTLDGDDPGGSFAFLLSRPGGHVDDTDRAWGRFLLRAGLLADVRLEMVHLATDERVVPLPPDELTERRTA